MRRRIFSLAAAVVLSTLSLVPGTPAGMTCEECEEWCRNIPQDPVECMAACCGSTSPVGGEPGAVSEDPRGSSASKADASTSR